MLTIAMYDAVNGIDRANGGGRQHAMVEPIGALRGARRDAAAMGAARAVLILLVPNQAATLHRLRDEERAAMGSSSAVSAGESWGSQVGHQVVARRNQDGTQSAIIIPAGTGPGAFRASFDARWANMTPFGIQSKAPYVSPAPPALTSSAYTVAFNAVKALGDPDADPTRNEISTFWLVEGGTGREPGISRLGFERPVSMKLRWRADIPASNASRSWLHPRRSRHSRSPAPNETFR